MLPHLILGAVGLLTGAFSGLLLLVIIGVRRGDSGKRLTGKPGSSPEALARRLLTRSVGCDNRDKSGEGR